MNHRLVTAAQLGQLLQTARRGAGRSQADLAATVGLSQSRRLQARTEPGHLTVDQLLALCASLDLELTLKPRSAGPEAAPPAGRLVGHRRWAAARTREPCRSGSNGVRVGSWHLPTRGDMELRYDPAWKASPLGRPLSLSLPFGLGDGPLRGPRVAAWFENLLPDSEEIRKRLATRGSAPTSTTAFDLLQAIGRDCVGAVQLLPEDEVPTGFLQLF